jgi:hypothetical protein
MGAGAHSGGQPFRIVDLMNELDENSLKNFGENFPAKEDFTPRGRLALKETYEFQKTLAEELANWVVEST